MVGCKYSCTYDDILGKLPKSRFDKKETGALVEEGEGDLLYKRYYHLFVKDELENLVDLNDGLIVSSGYDRDNWYCIVEKI